jgi:hypothetical protein
MSISGYCSNVEKGNDDGRCGLKLDGVITGTGRRGFRLRSTLGLLGLEAPTELRFELGVNDNREEDPGVLGFILDISDLRGVNGGV